MKRLFFPLFATLTLMACAHQPQPLAAPSQTKLNAAPLGEKIYLGQVSPQGSSAPTFEYERYVADHEGAMSATHVTRRAHDKEVLVWQQAQHRADYTLLAFEQVHAQTGVVCGVRVLEDGALAFYRGEGEAPPARSVERYDDALDVVVGPTLFGYVLMRWREAVAQGGITFRFASPERLTSYEFSLRCEPERAGEVACLMEATSMFVRWAVGPISITFNSASAPVRRVLRYQGPVPPRGEALSELKATVRYIEQAPSGFL